MRQYILEQAKSAMTYIAGFIKRLRKPDDHNFFGAVMVIIGLTIIQAVLDDRAGITTTAGFIRDRLQIPLTPYALLMAGCGAYLLASERPRLEIYLLVSMPILLYTGCVLATALAYNFPLTGAVIHFGMYAALLRDAGRMIDDPR